MIVFKNDGNIPEDFTGICKIMYTGTIYHMKDGKYHNETGPAIIWKDGSRFWCINNKYHNEDGPAVEYANGIKQWRYKDEFYGENNDFTIESWKEKVEELKHEEELEIFK